MDLWILNQNKDTLVKCEEIRLHQYENYYAIESNKVSNLGIYGSIDMGLKILDNIATELNVKKNVVYSLPPNE